ncbi:MAG TPA: Rrf2 family transcriptional regulator [Terriglobales bacterium]|nr:Rrf2 family transcriptional regulator [Terriglobales bacterium]
MQLTRAADYAVRVMVHMAGMPAGRTVRLRTLALAVSVPESFLAKVLQTLVRAGLVISRRGPDGGFELVPSSMQASILDVVEAIDGPVQLNACLGEEGCCEHKDWCPVQSVWAEAQIAMLSVLSRDTVGELALRAARNKEKLARMPAPPPEKAMPA